MDARSACIAAVNNDRDRIARHVNDDIIRGMFGVGLHVQAGAQLAEDTVQIRLEVAIRELDLIIAELGGVVFDRNPNLHLRSHHSTWT